jgi:hypothetical protein
MAALQIADKVGFHERCCIYLAEDQAGRQTCPDDARLSVESESCLKLHASGPNGVPAMQNLVMYVLLFELLLLMYQMVKAVSNHGLPCYHLLLWNNFWQTAREMFAFG